MAAEPADRYTLTSRVIHWATVALVLANPLVAIAMERTESREVFLAHASIGASVLVLTLVRLIWRVSHFWPPLPASMRPWERALARTTHVLFYPVLISVPLIGLATASTREGDAPIPIFGFIPLPQLPVVETEAAGEQWAQFHLWGVIALLLLVALHVMGAIKHTYFDQAGVLNRMWPGAGPQPAQSASAQSPQPR